MGVSKERMVHCDIECLTMSGVSPVCGDWYTLSEDKSQKKYLKKQAKISQIVRALASKPRSRDSEPSDPIPHKQRLLNWQKRCVVERVQSGGVVGEKWRPASLPEFMSSSRPPPHRHLLHCLRHSRWQSYSSSPGCCPRENWPFASDLR